MAQNLGLVLSVVTERRKRWTPGGSNQAVVPSGLVTPVKVNSLPVPSTRLMNLLERPAMLSALLGWMSSGSPKRVSPEMVSDQLLPAGDSECCSRLLYVSMATVLSPRPGDCTSVCVSSELPFAMLTRLLTPAPTGVLTYCWKYSRPSLVRSTLLMITGLSSGGLPRSAKSTAGL